MRIAAEATGARVVEVPELLAPQYRVAAQAARWRIRFDRDVVVRRLDTEVRERVRTVYLGIWDGVVWYLPAEEQPVSETLHYKVLGEAGEETGLRQVEVALRAGFPVRFVEVEPVG